MSLQPHEYMAVSDTDLVFPFSPASFGCLGALLRINQIADYIIVGLNL